MCGVGPATDPLLHPAALASNGGPTQTIALQADSPAINAGDETICAAVPVNNRDQRGFVRPGTGYTNCSIGAFEYNSPGPPSCDVGDCNNDQAVTIDELISLVNIALGTALPSVCPNGVPSGAEVNVALIIQAVNNALSGCPVLPTPTPTRTPTPTYTPTLTPTPPPFGKLPIPLGESVRGRAVMMATQVRITSARNNAHASAVAVVAVTRRTTDAALCNCPYAPRRRRTVCGGWSALPPPLRMAHGDAVWTDLNGAGHRGGRRGVQRRARAVASNNALSRCGS